MRNWAYIGEVNPLGLIILLAAPAFAADRKPALDKRGCTAYQASLLDKALRFGRIRVAAARKRMKESDPTAVAAAKAVFRADFAQKMTVDVWLADIERVLTDPAVRKQCADEGGACEGVPAFVPARKPERIVFCPDFFAIKNAEARTRVAVHEAAHVAGATPEETPNHCPAYSCESACTDQSGGGRKKYAREYNAENWSQFVYCAAGGESETLGIKGDARH